MSLTWYINVYSELTFTYWPYSKHTINKKLMKKCHLFTSDSRDKEAHLEGQPGPRAVRPQLQPTGASPTGTSCHWWSALK